MTPTYPYPPVQCPKCGYNKLFSKNGRTECTAEGCDYLTSYDEEESIKISLNNKTTVVV